MIEHSTYGGQLEPFDLLEGIKEQVFAVVSAEEVAFESGPDDGMELVVESTLPRLEKRAVRGVVRDAVGVDQVVLSLRISFREARYEVYLR